MILYDLTFRYPCRPTSGRHRLAGNLWGFFKNGYWVLLPPFALWWAARQYVFAQNPPLPISSLDNSLLAGDAWTSRLTALKILGKYLWLLLWPQKLAADYSYHQIPLVHWPFQSGANWLTVVALLAIAIPLGLAIRFRHRDRLPLFLMMFFGITLLPTANVMVFCGATMAERFLYLPLVAGAALIGLGCLALARRVHPEPRTAMRLATFCFALLAAGYAGRTWLRNQDWQDNLTFWRRLAETSPESYRAQVGYALALSDQTPRYSQIDAALERAGRALALVPDSLDVLIAAGTIYRIKGDSRTGRAADGAMLQTAESQAWYRRSLESLREAMRRVHEPDSSRRPATRGCEKTVQKLELLEQASVEEELGRTEMRLGNATEAIESFLKARRVKPTLARLHERLAYAYLAADQLEPAAVCFWEDILMNPQSADSRLALIGIYERLPNAGCAVVRQGRQTRIDGRCPRVHEHLCQAHRELTALFLGANQWRHARDARLRAVTKFGCHPEDFAPASGEITR